jgi:hypothetical protein
LFLCSPSQVSKRFHVRGLLIVAHPSFLYLLPPGLSDPEHPEWGSRGGRFKRLNATSRFYVGAGDDHPETQEARRRSSWTVGRWNQAISNDFAEPQTIHLILTTGTRNLRVIAESCLRSLLPSHTEFCANPAHEQPLVRIRLRIGQLLWWACADKQTTTPWRACVSSGSAPACRRHIAQFSVAALTLFTLCTTTAIRLGRGAVQGCISVCTASASAKEVMSPRTACPIRQTCWGLWSNDTDPLPGLLPWAGHVISKFLSFRKH